jgi:hypothetical protein
VLFAGGFMDIIFEYSEPCLLLFLLLLLLLKLLALFLAGDLFLPLEFYSKSESSTFELFFFPNCFLAGNKLSPLGLFFICFIS